MKNEHDIHHSRSKSIPLQMECILVINRRIKRNNKLLINQNIFLIRDLPKTI